MFIYLHYLYVLVYLSCCIYLLVHLYILFTPSPFIYCTLYCFLYCPIYIYIYRNLGTIYIYIYIYIFVVLFILLFIYLHCLYLLVYFSCCIYLLVHLYILFTPSPFTHTHMHTYCAILLCFFSLSLITQKYFLSILPKWVLNQHFKHNMGMLAREWRWLVLPFLLLVTNP